MSDKPAPAFGPSTCILHTTVHHVTPACWVAMTDWYLANVVHLDGVDRLHAYQAAAEKQMLAALDQPADLKET